MYKLCFILVVGPVCLQNTWSFCSFGHMGNSKRHGTIQNLDQMLKPGARSLAQGYGLRWEMEINLTIGFHRIIPI